MTPSVQVRRSRSSARTILGIGAIISAIAFLVALLGLALDPSVIAGAPAWSKPAKFGLSITIYLVTLRWIASFIRGHARLLNAISAVLVVTFTAEIVLVDLQVLRGTTSHFNEATAFDATVLYSMAGLISLAFLATVIAGVLALLQRGMENGQAAGIRWGIGVSVLGMLLAILMITNTGWNDAGGHTVGAPDGGIGMPITGWSLDHGDLRIPHFVGLHGLQVLALLPWGLARWTTFDARTRVRLVHVSGVAYTALVALLAWQALRGQSLLHPDGWTLLAAAALIALTALGTAAVLSSANRRVVARRRAG